MRIGVGGCGPSRTTKEEKVPNDPMPAFKPDTFHDRVADRNKARAAELERAKKRAEAMKETSAERAAERARIAKERDERQALREAEKKAEAERLEAEQRAAEEARIAAEEEAKLEAERAQKEEMAKFAELLAAQKANRDARYAARKARQKR